ncbi:MAG: GTPase HflX [Paracoccaceae bacterium]
MNEHDPHVTRAWVLHPDINSRPARAASAAALEEAVALAAALPGLTVAGSDVVRLAKVQPGLLFGKGKVAELKARFEADDIELVLIDGPVSPVQQRNLEEAWNVKLLDRTGLILEIFSDRAQTREGVLQVEMAALSYQRTRLVRAWTHLERQRGGLGFVGGPGETQIEADRRAIDDAIVRIRRQLAKVVKTRALHRAARAKIPFPIVALVGYTNTGKSTLFNRLTGANVVAQDMLFATLDPTMRAVKLPTGKDIILSDTVGFISDLPTELVAAFRATLEEVLSADLIVHIRDISHAQSAAQAQDVETILQTLGVGENVTRLEVWNKIDKLSSDDRATCMAQSQRTPGVLAISAQTGEGLDELIELITELLDEERFQRELTLKFARGRERAWLFEEGVVEAETQIEDGYRLLVNWTPRQEKQFRELAPAKR